MTGLTHTAEDKAAVGIWIWQSGSAINSRVALAAPTLIVAVRMLSCRNCCQHSRAWTLCKAMMVHKAFPVYLVSFTITLCLPLPSFDTASFTHTFTCNPHSLTPAHSPGHLSLVTGLKAFPEGGVWHEFYHLCYTTGSHSRFLYAQSNAHCPPSLSPAPLPWPC